MKLGFIGSVDPDIGMWTQCASFPEGPERVRRSLSEKEMLVAVVSRLLMSSEADLEGAGNGVGCTVGWVAMMIQFDA